MKANYQILVLFLVILIAFNACKNDENCILSVRIFKTDLGAGETKLSAVADGGLIPFTYKWTGTTETDSVFFGVNLSGNCGVLVTDDAGCTAYASISLNTCDSVVFDNDNNKYYTVKIGSQCWLKSNVRSALNFQNITDNNFWQNVTTPAFCYYNNKNDDNAPKGLKRERLYNYYAVASGKLCPNGWHIPTYAEWQTLIDNQGNIFNAGAYLKYTDFWNPPNHGATNSSGFSAVPGGIRQEDGIFTYAGERAVFWSSTEVAVGSKIYYGLILYHDGAQIESLGYNRNNGFSCRCIED